MTDLRGGHHDAWLSQIKGNLKGLFVDQELIENLLTLMILTVYSRAHSYALVMGPTNLFRKLKGPLNCIHMGADFSFSVYH